MIHYVSFGFWSLFVRLEISIFRDMSVFRSLASTLFSPFAFGVLCSSGWKRATVYANLRHVKDTCGGLPADVSRFPSFYEILLRNLARHAGELLSRFSTFKKLPSLTSSYPCRIDGIDFAIAEGSAPVLEKMRGGGIFLTAHYGNYEAIGPWLCRLGIPLVASYIPVRPAWLNRILDKRIRSVDGRPYGVDARTPREFLRLLDGGKLVCLLADQDSRIPSALDGEFLGNPVRNNPLPDFLLKHRPETPVYICWLEDGCGRRGDGSAKGVRTLHAIELSRTLGSGATDSLSIMTRYNAWLETRIGENPALWYGWTHRRFYSKSPEIYAQETPRKK